MATIHFLNVKEGDCSIIKHNSDRVTVIDVCNAKAAESHESQLESIASRIGILEAQLTKSEAGGNFRQKNYPVNPVDYLKQHDESSIFRYIQTHPDMDHMDGIKVLFDEFKPLNFWDTENRKEMSSESWSGSPYNQSDWQFYKKLRDYKPSSDPKRLTLLSGDEGQFWNIGDDTSGGDGLQILAPTQELLDTGNNSEDYNDCSYVLLYRTGSKRIVFGGDSHDNTWEHILSTYESELRDIDLLIAPHHGRKSGRSYEFLNVLRPALTFFGNARSEHLAYNAWNYRKLKHVTNNEANCMVVDASATPMDLYVTNETYARRENPSTFYNKIFKAWFAYPIAR